MKKQQEKQTVVPYFMVLNASQFIEFTEKTFQSEVLKINKLEGTEGIIHAEMKIGNSIVYFADTSADGSCGPGVCGELKNDGLIPVQMYVYVEDAIETYQKAVAAGAMSVMEPTEEMGSMGGFADPLGNLWWVQSKDRSEK
ncbi:VOC family protein [Enterococcus mediterraneensis]|uniref:VOC family protein n=1 Tax=Enterococcus mediterraneensis TaxID=2364791 RepID=UPI000F04F819|nr:VOC family protein [Enterococcus mediterraneensis]